MSSTPRRPDLVVLSHLRWNWVWQRPQHLISRLAAARSDAGGHTWFVEEPRFEPGSTVRLRTESAGPVTRVWLAIPRRRGGSPAIGFDHPTAADYGARLATLLADQGSASPDVWLYTPMAQDIAEVLQPGLLIYDVMDDLAAFRGASPQMVHCQQTALRRADLVFTGGRSLHRSVIARRPEDPTHLFPSGVDQQHYERSRHLRTRGDRPVAGYVGVIDERLDLSLLAGLAERLPDWTIRIVGPVAKIDPATLPQAPTIEYTGMAEYADLPGWMAGFDVALMPFARNEATASISPTKTLEYLAAGLPVVSTPIRDVVDDYPTVVAVAADADGFADACRSALDQDPDERDRRAAPLIARSSWDAIARRMDELVVTAGRTARQMTPATGAEATA